MPRLSRECHKAVKDYHKLMYSHWSDAQIKDRQRKVIHALKQAGKGAQDKYLAEVEEFRRTNNL